MGTAISGKFDLNEAFWQKMEKINQRKSKRQALIGRNLDSLFFYVF
jgi:hypothetical protein